MRPEDMQVLTEFSERVRTRFPDAEIWAFGSRARGGASPEADLDVCIVLPDLSEQIDQAVMDVAWEAGFRHGLVISTVTYSAAEFHHGPCRESTLVRSILREGLAA